LKNPANLTQKQTQQLEDLKKSNLKTAKVYRMKLVFQEIYRTIKEPKNNQRAENSRRSNKEMALLGSLLPN